MINIILSEMLLEYQGPLTEYMIFESKDYLYASSALSQGHGTGKVLSGHVLSQWINLLTNLTGPPSDQFMDGQSPSRLACTVEGLSELWECGRGASIGV